MAAGVRFALYKFLMAMTQRKDFKRQQVLPLELPRSEHIRVDRLAPEFPRLYRPATFPSTEHAGARHRRIMRTKPLLGPISRIPPSHTAPVPADPAAFVEAVYPDRYRRIWPHPPFVPDHLANSEDKLATLAVRGPFAGYLRAIAGTEQGDPTGGLAHEDDYVIDMKLFEAYPAKRGLARPGGIAVFGVEGDRLFTRGIVRDGALHAPDSSEFPRLSRLFLCALNTHLTTLAHNSTVHLSYVTPIGVATINELPPDHPIRRLLHAALHTTMIGNFEVGTFQVVGTQGFSTKLFSHEYPALVDIINRHVEAFHIADLDPERDVAKRCMEDTPFPQPRRDNLLGFWRVTREYVRSYVGLYFADDAAVAADGALGRWRARLDELLPVGLADGDGYIGDGPLTREELERICAVFLHTSTVTHDQLNNVVWNYSTLNFLIPTVVPESGEHQDQRISFDFINTLIGTWKPYNMLLDGISILALDEAAREVMDDYVRQLKQIDADLPADREPDFTYARYLNVSVSN
jgi:arachidonate 15-lipoxygenase